MAMESEKLKRKLKILENTARTNGAIDSINEGMERYVFEASSLKGWFSILFICVLFSIGFLYYLFIAIETCALSVSYKYYGIFGLLILTFVYIINGILTIKAIKEIRFTNRYNKYYKILSNHSVIILEELAEMMKDDSRTIKKDLTYAIKKGLIPQGHFTKDISGNYTLFFTSDLLYSLYCGSLSSTQKRC